MRKLIILALFLSTPAWAAITAATHWNVRQDGTSTAGACFDSTIAGAGTNRTLSGSVYMTIDNAAITATTAGAGSNVISFTAGYSAAAADVGNCVQMTAGTNITAGFYQITGESHTDCATFTDCTWTVSGAANLTTGGGAGSALVGKMGGALGDFWTTAIPYVAGNTIDVGGTGAGTGTFTRTTTLFAMATAGTTTAVVTVRGYTTTPGDSVGTVASWTGPTLTSATNSINLLTLNAASFTRIEKIKFTHTAATRGNCIQGVTTNGSPVIVNNSVFSGCGIGFNATNRISTFGIFNSDFTGTTVNSISSTVAVNAFLMNNRFYNNTGSAFLTTGTAGTTATLTAMYNVFAANGRGIYHSGTAGRELWTIVGNTCDSNTVACIESANTTTATQLVLQNNILWNNSTDGIKMALSVDGLAGNSNNAYGSNGTARTGISAGTGDVTLTASPFISATNWALNNTAGGGASCRAAAFPGAFPDAVTIGYLDIGAVQHRDFGPTFFVQ